MIPEPKKNNNETRSDVLKKMEERKRCKEQIDKEIPKLEKKYWFYIKDTPVDKFYIYNGTLKAFTIHKGGMIYDVTKQNEYHLDEQNLREEDIRSQFQLTTSHSIFETKEECLKAIKEHGLGLISDYKRYIKNIKESIKKCEKNNG